MVFAAMEALVEYALERGLIQREDKICVLNRLMERMQLDYCSPGDGVSFCGSLAETLSVLTDVAVARSVAEDTRESRDRFDAKLMGALTPMPHEVIARFQEEYKKSPQDATDYYYTFSRATNYIRDDRTKRDIRWQAETEYGLLDITINLAKPEKDPRDIIAAGRTEAFCYPKCLLCAENEGYAGRPGHPARQNHRIIPLALCGEEWFLQYSPYVYYNEHCIVLNKKHVPMQISGDTFRKLLAFVEMFPHYFIGSNADLPIVGGSILSHDHFQGGRYEFPMERAANEDAFMIGGFSDVEAHTIRWPMFTLRLRCVDAERLAQAAERVLAAWRDYTDVEAFIFAETDGVLHNTITPIARWKNGNYEMDLVLRNNITTQEHPLGVYHPHADKHHIKKENIGLIEVMGLAVLPARLQEEMSILKNTVIDGKKISETERIAAHAEWAEGFLQTHEKPDADNLDQIIRDEIGKVFCGVLEDAGVFHDAEAGKRFLRTLE